MKATAEEPPPAEIALGRIVRAAAELLEREMEAIVDGFLDLEGLELGTRRYHTAGRAYRIVLLCRDIGEEITRYESYAAREEEGDLPF